MYQMCDMIYNIYTKNHVDAINLYRKKLQDKTNRPDFLNKTDDYKIVITYAKEFMGIIVELYTNHEVTLIPAGYGEPTHIEGLLEENTFNNWIEDFINEDIDFIDLDINSEVQDEETLIDLL